MRGNLGKLTLLILAATSFIASGCGGSPATTPQPVTPSTYQGSYPIKVLATTGMVADLVQNVGGSHVEVTQLMGPRVDPHLYKASAGDVRLLSNADVICYSGRNLEGKMGDLFVRMARQRPTFAVTEHIDDDAVLEDDDGHWDPHLWFDVSLWSKGVGAVRDVFEQFDPKHAADYRKNAADYQARLAELHRWVQKEIASIPPERRVLVTAHDAFRYFGKAYGIEVKAIQGISTEDEASVKQINELVQFIATRQIKAVFVESSVPRKYVEALQEGCLKGRGHRVEIGGELFSDAMGDPGTPEGSYEGMIRHNVNTIVKALK
jgi:manganese/zinc/iron transport system substrate-binding protein